MIRAIVYLFTLLSASALAYQEYTAPGVGIPVISFTQSSYTFCVEPSLQSECKEKTVRQGKQFQVYGSDTVLESLVKTIEPVELIAKEDFVITKKYFEHSPSNINIKKGQKLFKLSPTIKEASAFIDINTLPTTIKINDKIYSLHMQNLSGFVTNFNKQPKTEWWLKVKNKGWLLVTQNNVKHHQRQWAAG